MRDSKRSKQEKWSDFLPLMLCLALAAVFVLRYDFYFDLNDDFMMEHILSGKYTGIPEFRNIQSLYPLSLILGFLYRCAVSIPWYGIFLIGCQFGALYHILSRIQKRTNQTTPVVFAVGIAAAVMWYHFVFVQYSVTVGILCAAAAVDLLTVQKEEVVFAEKLSRKERGSRLFSVWKGPLIFLTIAFLLRTEMTIFVLPFVALAFWWRLWTLHLEDERAGVLPIFLRICTIGVLFLAELCILFGVAKGIDTAAYHAPDWQEFRDYFDERTQLYDFLTIPSYEDNTAFYEENGISAEQVTLLQNYNFGIDETIDSKMLHTIVEYARAQKAEEQSTATRVRGAVSWYRQVLLSRSEYPYNLISAIFYLVACGTVIAGLVLCAKERSVAGIRQLLFGFVQVVLIFLARSILWVYLLYHNRPVVRLTHCIYLFEVILLFAVWWELVKPLIKKKEHRPSKIIAAATTLILAAALFVGTWMQVGLADAERERRASVNKPYTALLNFTKENEDFFYFVDVFSTVDFSEKMFDNKSDLQGAYSAFDMMGGWVCKSPLYGKKLEERGISSMEEGLLSGGVFFVCRSDYDTDWLVDYYKQKGKAVTVQKTDEIGSYWTVYQLEMNET